MTGTDKEAMRRVGVTTVQSLATLKDFRHRQHDRTRPGTRSGSPGQADRRHLAGRPPAR